MGLIPDFTDFDKNSLEDFLLAAMKECDNAMCQTGAMPGTDYSRKDLMIWAIELYRTKRIFEALTHE